MANHSTQTGANLHNPFPYQQSSDPGAVGAQKFWFDTTNNRVKVRNAANTSWTDLCDAATFAAAARLVFSATTNDGDRVVFDGQNLTSKPYYEIPVSVKGAVGDGVNDDTAAIQAALDAAEATGQECRVLLDTLGANYKITDTLRVGTKGWLEGVGFHAQMPKISMHAADITKPAITNKDYDASGGSSRMKLKNFRLEDERTDPARTGPGIFLDYVTNGEFIDGVMVFDFYDNIKTGTTAGNQDNDVVRISNCWSQRAIRYCYNLRNLANNVMLDHNVAAAEGASDPTDAGWYISADRSCVITMISSKMEVANGCDMIELGNAAGSITIIGATMRGAGPGRDVVRVSSGNGTGITLMDITTRNTLSPFSDAVTVATNLLNILNSGDGTPLVIPNSARVLKFWTGGAYAGASGVKQQAMWIGKCSFSAGPGSPEGVVSANPGSMYFSHNGNAYRKGSGTGNTGWVTT